jgi:hypothetical protein
MAQKTLIELVDDLDGTKAVETVTFGLDGVTYEIDLSGTHADDLRESLAEYVEAARRTGGRIRRGLAPQRQESGVNAGAVREWAEANGIEVAARGRIPAHVIESYNEANKDTSDKAPAKAPRATRKKAAAR